MLSFSDHVNTRGHNQISMVNPGSSLMQAISNKQLMAPPRHVQHPRPMRRNEYAEAFETGFAATRWFLLSCGAPVEEAEEIAQAAWVRGWEYRGQLRNPHAVGAWVNSIARNLLRKFRSKTMMPLDEADAPYMMRLENIELGRLLERCPQRDRALLERTLQGYSTEEIARQEGISPTGIRVRMMRILRSLRAQLDLA